VITNSGFRGTFFPGKVGFSEEKIIGEVQSVSNIESIEIFKEFFHIFSKNVNSIKFGFFIFEHGFNISFFEKIHISSISFLERFNEESEKVVPFLERNFIIMISISGLENKFDFSETHVMSFIDIKELI
jgi:hypothetical protein